MKRKANRTREHESINEKTSKKINNRNEKLGKQNEKITGRPHLLRIE